MIFTDIDEDFVLLASVVNGDFFKGMRNAKVELIFKIIIDGVLSDDAVELRHKSHIKVININNRGTAINYPCRIRHQTCWLLENPVFSERMMSTMILSREIMLVCDLRPCCSISSW